MQLTCPCCSHTFDPEETAPNKIKPADVVNLYNEYAVKYKWQRVVKSGDAMKKKLMRAIKELPELDQWHAVMRGLAADDFFSGRKSDYKTNIDTLIFKSRYMTFYNAGLEAPVVETVDSILDEFKELLK